MTHILDTSGPGGAENVLISLVRGLDRDKFESLICVRENSWIHRQLGNDNCTFFLNDTLSLDFSLLSKLVRYIRSNEVDIVHSHEFSMNVYGTVAAKLAGVPSVATVHGQVDYASSRLRRRMAYRMMAGVSCLVMVSNRLATRFSEQVGVPRQRIRTIYNGIPTEKFQLKYDLDSLRSELKIPAGLPVVGMVGNLYPVKGYEYFIRAMRTVRKRFPETVFLICGRGGLQHELESLAAELGLNNRMKFLGFRDDVPAILQMMNVFVLSSLSEGMSLSILEAMAAGKPTVVTDVGGNPEIVVDGETGFIVPPRKPGVLAEKVCLLLEDQRISEKMGTNGRIRVNALFTQERMVRNYQDLYVDLIEKGRLKHK